MSSILGAATSLLSYGDRLDAAAQTDLLGQIKQESEELDEMVRNLLAITRIDAGALELRRDWIDLREIVQRVASAVRRRGAMQRIDIAMLSGLPLVRADAALAEQAIGNVVANAVVHTSKDTHIVIDAQAGSSGIAVRVTDDGPGISSDILPHIFDRFVTGSGADEVRDGGQGTGLGLLINAVLTWFTLCNLRVLGASVVRKSKEKPFTTRDTETTKVAQSKEVAQRSRAATDTAKGFDTIIGSLLHSGGVKYL